jgi:hypothetical protein
MKQKPKHGGKRPGTGRKPGKKAFKKAKPNPTEVRRIPIPLLEMIDQKLEEYYESIGYKKLRKGRSLPMNRSKI